MKKQSISFATGKSTSATTKQPKAAISFATGKTF